jgi:hypothetical protein
MNNLQKYIREVLGTEIRLKVPGKKELEKLPLYLRNNLKIGELLGHELMFVVKTNLTPTQYQKQAKIIENVFRKPVIYVIDSMEQYNRKRLIDKKIGFIVPGRQMYIPNLLIDFKEYGKIQVKAAEKFYPATQCLLFYLLLGNDMGGMNFKTIANKLNYGTMTITRAANVLDKLDLCKIKGNKEKRLVFERDKGQIWKEAQDYLINPVNKEYYTDDYYNFKLFYKTGINALSYYTEIAETNKNLYAVFYKSFRTILKENKLNLINLPDANTTIQVWKYDPGILASNGVVDPLSLYLTLKENSNERVQGELHKLMAGLW